MNLRNYSTVHFIIMNAKMSIEQSKLKWASLVVQQ